MRISFASCLITGVEAKKKKRRSREREGGKRKERKAARVAGHDVGGAFVVTRIHQSLARRARVSNGGPLRLLAARVLG